MKGSNMSDGALAEVDQVKVTVLPDGRVDRKNAAKALGLQPKTLAEWKRLGKGPRSFRVGGRCFYRWDDVRGFASGGGA